MEIVSQVLIQIVFVLDYAPTQFQIKIKEAMYIDWEKSNLNKQLNHLAATLSI